jgi:hypothetical protein
MEINRKYILMKWTTFKDLAGMMGVSYATLRREIMGNDSLMQRLHEMGWRQYQRFRREHVLEIFKLMGYPDGYEWYEKECREL